MIKKLDFSISRKGFIFKTVKLGETFKTLIISSANLVNGSYYLYQNGSFTGEAVNGVYLNTTYHKGDVMPILGNAPFQVASNITLIGNRQFR